MQKAFQAGWVGAVIGIAALTTDATVAQVRPDATLGAESSRVRADRVTGRDGVTRDSDVIEGGAQRGGNLFHSFEQFDVPEGRGAYFANPADVRNIFSRVTGNDRSEINGTLGVFGDANLFFMNPNGILFGPNSSLDVGGSFVGTTANSIGFGEQGFFAADDGIAPGLLTVDPSVFLFNQIATQNIPSITNQANVGFGLQVSNGENLLLLGGSVENTGGRLSAFEGRVDIGAVAGVGAVKLNADGSLSFPAMLAREDVSFSDQSQVNVALSQNGSIGVTARNINILGNSLLKAGIDTNSGIVGSQAGDLNLNATGDVQVRQGSRITNDVNPGAIGESGNIIITADSLNLIDGGQIRVALGSADPDNGLIGAQGKAGNIQIKLSDAFIATGSGSDGLPSVVFTGVGDGAIGAGGSIDIQANSLSFTNGAQILAATFGQGNAGRIGIRANDTMVFDGTSTGGDSAGVFGYVGDGAVGDGGEINIKVNSLSFTNGAQILADTYGQGNAGRISIRADNTIVFDGIGINSSRSGIFSSVYAASGVAENRIAGDITIDSDRIALTNGAGIVSNVETGAVGEGGDIIITADSLNLINGSQIQASLQESNSVNELVGSQNRAGNIQIILSGAFTARGVDSSGFPSIIISGVAPGAVGSGGNVDIQADSLSFTNGAQIESATYGWGNAGRVNIRADGAVVFDGKNEASGWLSGIFGSVNNASGFTGNRVAGDITIDAGSLIVSNGATIASNLEAGAIGTGGNINITADDLNLTNGGQIQAILREADSATGLAGAQGNSGNIRITLSDAFTATGADNSDFPSSLLTEVGAGAVGTGGNITIQSNSLSLTQGAQLLARTLGEGNAGQIDIDVDNHIFIDGTSPSGRFSGMFSNIERTGSGRGGNITISTDELSLTNGGRVSATSLGKGDAGNVKVSATDSISLDSGRGEFVSGIFSAVEQSGIGAGGNIDLSARILSLTDGAQFIASTRGQGNAGNVTVNATDSIFLDGGRGEFVSGVFSTVERSGVGTGGDINVNTRTLSLTDGAQLIASTRGQGNAGSVTVNATDSVSLDGVSSNGFSSGIFTDTSATATGRGNSIRIDTPTLRLSNGAVINAGTANDQLGGNITIDANTLKATSGGQIITTTTDNGQAGNIILEVLTNIILSGRDITFNNRLDTFGRDDTANEGNGESGLFANTRPNSTGNGGTITLGTNVLNLLDGAQVVAFTAGTGNPGNILIHDTDTINLDSSTISTAVNSGAVLSNPNANQGNIDIQTRSLSLTNGAEITASTSGTGTAGNIRVRDAEKITLDRNSSISTTVNQGALGNGGNIDIDTETLNLDRSNITSSTSGQGNTGSIDIQATDRIALRDNSSISSTVNRGATGDSQRITLNTPNLSLSGESQISAATNGNGRAGDVQIEADRIALSNSTISTQVGRYATVPANTNTQSHRQQADHQSDRQGNITLNTRSLTLNNGADITSGTNGRGRAGNIIVRNADHIAIDDESAISTAVGRQGRGRGGNIQLQTEFLSLDHDAQINAQTRGRGSAGNITLKADRLEARNKGQLTTSTSSDRSAGNIALNIQDVTDISDNGSGIFANTTANGTGGSVILNTDTLNLNDRARISARSAGRGTAGDIQINTENLNANDSTLETAATRSSGGTIQVNPNDRTGRVSLTNSNITTNSQDQGGNVSLGAEQIRLRGDSDITTSSGGNGGNIDLTAASIIAFDDSDILANSSNAKGGNITLDTPAFFGSGYVPNQTATDELDGNNRVDVNASGSTASGTIQTPDTSFIQNSLSDLPANAIDPDTLLANSCIARTRDGGTFLITGTGGLLTDRPDAIPLSSYPTDTVRTEPDDSNWQPGDPIMEPQAVYQLPDGELILSRECQ